MSRMQQFKDQQKKLTRFQALKSIFSSMLITTTAIIIAVVVIPASPKAEIQSINAFTDAITYTVNVTDSDNAIIDGTLELVLENQFDTYHQTASPGVNSGMFSSLEPDTKYTLRVVADKGFGPEVLASQSLSTAPNPGGAITGILLLTEDDQYTLDYQIDYYISDPFFDYTQIQISYAVKYSSELEYQSFTTSVLGLGSTQMILPSIYNENLSVLIRLEAINTNMETVLLDEVEFHTPYQIYAYIYPVQITSTTVSLSAWVEAMDVEDVVLELTLMEGYVVQQKQTFTPTSFYDQYYQHSEDQHIIFEHLKPNTTYYIELSVRYSDPYTKQEVVKPMEGVEFTTSPRYSYEYLLEDLGDYYLVTITLNDPENIIDTAYYEVYQQIDEYEQYMEGQNFQIIPDGEVKTIQFEIYKPTYDFSRIIIGIRNSFDYTKYETIEVITE